MILLLTDTHFGVRNFNKSIFDEQLEYFHKIVFPYILDNNIKEVVHLGDLFDNRQNIEVLFLDYVYKKFISFFNENKINLHLISGNHDIYYKNTNEINSLEIFKSEYIKVYSEPKIYEKNIENYNIAIIPWLGKNEITFNRKYDIILGHFEFKDFYLNSKIIAREGYNSDKISEYAKIVLSGHYHIKSNSKNVYYLGSPYQLDWNDFDSVKGFHIIDNHRLKFIPNNFSTKFLKIYYNETNEKIDIKISGLEPNKVINADIDNIEKIIKNNWIKIITFNIINRNLFDIFYENILSKNQKSRIEIFSHNELKLNDENIDLDIESINIENNIKDYISKFLDSYIQTNNKDLVKEEFINLYTISEKEK
jgi:DNA repair exonuclease SbcCD nuclease subunit